MFGPGITTVFASRWRALWWAASILLLAYCSVPSPDDDSIPAAQPSAVSDPTAATLPDGQGGD